VGSPGVHALDRLSRFRAMVDRTASAPMRFHGFRRRGALRASVDAPVPELWHAGDSPSWFKLVPACRRCHLRPERGEFDYFLGGMMFNVALV